MAITVCIFAVVIVIIFYWFCYLTHIEVSPRAFIFPMSKQQELKGGSCKSMTTITKNYYRWWFHSILPLFYDKP